MIRRLSRFFTPAGWTAILSCLMAAAVLGCVLGVIEADRRAACSLNINEEC